MATLSVLMIGVAVAAVAWTLLATLFSEERAVSRRLSSLSEYEVSQAQAVEPLAQPFRKRVLSPVGAGAGRRVRSLLPAGIAKSLKRQIRLAGLQGRIDPFPFFLIIVAGGILGFFLGTAVARTLFESSVARFFTAAVVVALGLAVPVVWLNGRVSSRQTAIRKALPDALDMLMIAVEAGLGFDAALSKYILASEGPLAEEMAGMLGEMQAGISRGDAFRHLVDRTEVPELETFALAMTQADLLGVSVSHVLRTQAHEMRVKRRQRAEEQAQKAPAKMVFPLVLCILPATLVVLVGPAVIAIARAFGAGF